MTGVPSSSKISGILTLSIPVQLSIQPPEANNNKK